MNQLRGTCIKSAGPEVIKLKYRLKLKIKRNDWPIVALYFEFENELKFYNLGPGGRNNKYTNGNGLMTRVQPQDNFSYLKRDKIFNTHELIFINNIERKSQL